MSRGHRNQPAQFPSSSSSKCSTSVVTTAPAAHISSSTSHQTPHSFPERTLLLLFAPCRAYPLLGLRIRESQQCSRSLHYVTEGAWSQNICVTNTRPHGKEMRRQHSNQGSSDTILLFFLVCVVHVCTCIHVELYTCIHVELCTHVYVYIQRPQINARCHSPLICTLFLRQCL